MGSNSRRLTMGSYGEFGKGSIIYYSSINSDIVTPYSTTAFGDARIIHNIYNNGIGEIKFDRELTTIGNNAFRDCSGLTSVVIPDSVISIGDEAFYNCNKLTGLTFGSGVTSIGSYAFIYCDGLTSLTLGSGVTSIGTGAFSRCSGLISITCKSPIAPSIYSYTFYQVKNGGILYYPLGSDYSKWLSTASYYLGYYNWIGAPIQTN